MPPYKNSDSKTITSDRFLRLHRRIFSGDADRYTHEQLAEEEGLLELIEETRRNDPTEVDAGFVIGKSVLKVSGRSDRLMLPEESWAAKARAKTLEDFSQQSPGKEIRG